MTSRPLENCVVIFRLRLLATGANVVGRRSNFGGFDDISEWFHDRDPEEHRTNAEAWQYCTTRDERDAHVSANLVRWSKMLRLPYFNPIRHLIVDPMHSLFLELLSG